MNFRATLTMVTMSAVAVSSLAPLQAPRAQASPTLTNAVPESASVTMQAKITALNQTTRAITLTGASGASVSMVASPAVRLDLLKVGQSVNAQYYRSVGFVVNPPAGGSNSAPTSDDKMTTIVAQAAHAPGGAALVLTKVSGTVIGINMAEHSIEVINPSGGGAYTLDVTDPARVAMLGSLKVGDTITAVISEALAVTVDPAPKSWF